MVDRHAIIYGILAGLGLLIFYLIIVSTFQGIEFAFLSLRSLWYLLFPLAIGFGTQVGLYFSIRHTAQLAGVVASTGAISGGSMIACCSHFILSFIPLVGASAIASFLVKYQSLFLGFANRLLGLLTFLILVIGLTIARLVGKIKVQ